MIHFLTSHSLKQREAVAKEYKLHHRKVSMWQRSTNYTTEGEYVAMKYKLHHKKVSTWPSSTSYIYHKKVSVCCVAKQYKLHTPQDG